MIESHRGMTTTADAPSSTIIAISGRGSCHSNERCDALVTDILAGQKKRSIA